jgi:excisionase family DNA binding protein
MKDSHMRNELLGTTVINDDRMSRPPVIRPLAMTILETSRITGLSRSKIYRCLAKKEIRAIKSGSRTLILMDSLRQHLESLPLATFKTPAGSE